MLKIKQLNTKKTPAVNSSSGKTVSEHASKLVFAFQL